MSVKTYRFKAEPATINWLVQEIGLEETTSEKAETSLCSWGKEFSSNNGPFDTPFEMTYDNNQQTVNIQQWRW